jgi:putative oxidoreductase
MKFLVLLGRILFSLIFLMTILGHFSAPAIGYAASQGVPAASILVPLSGIIAFLGAVSIILGYKAKIGAWLIIIFLLPVTFSMHKFWAMTDPMMQQMQMAMFMKNISITGAALLITYFGSGPLSIDSKKA